jgi:GTPase SAR1 family protein
VNLVVLGTSNVGKSTFVQRALDLKQPALTPTTAKKMSLDGMIYVVKLIEIPLEEIGIVDNSRIAWPEEIDDSPMPTVDGVLALLDISDCESVADFPEVLSKFNHCYQLQYQAFQRDFLVGDISVFTIQLVLAQSNYLAGIANIQFQRGTEHVWRTLCPRLMQMRCPSSFLANRNRYNRATQ